MQKNEAEFFNDNKDMFESGKLLLVYDERNLAEVDIAAPTNCDIYLPRLDYDGYRRCIAGGFDFVASIGVLAKQDVPMSFTGCDWGCYKNSYGLSESTPDAAAQAHRVEHGNFCPMSEC